jgi:uncharacterized protein (DUF433 family)
MLWIAPWYTSGVAVHYRNELRCEYPELEDEDIRQSLTFAASDLEERSTRGPK